MSADIGAYGEELYEQVLPLHGPDPDGLARDLIGAWTHGAREIDELVRDTPKGPGWGVILDVDDAPVKGLPWLAQLAGVTLRQPKMVTAELVTNANRELASSAGWTSGFTGTGSPVSAITAGTSGMLYLPGGFHVHLTSAGAASGAWTILRPSGRAAVIAARPNVYYGFSMRFVITDAIGGASGQLFRTRAWFFDQDFGVISNPLMASSGAGTDIYSPGDSETLVSFAQAPEGTAYVGMGFEVPAGVSANPLNAELDVGEVIVLEIATPEITYIPSWPWMPEPTLETDEEWAVYARDAIRRQGGRNRGTPDAILSAAEDTMTGNRDARLVERVGGNAYRFTLVTRPSETPDPVSTLERAAAQVPAGSKITLSLVEGAAIDEGTRTIDTATGTIDAATLSDIT